MVESLSDRGAAWLGRRRAQLVDLAALWAASLLCEWSAMSRELPPQAILCALLIADAIPGRLGPEGERAGRNFTLNLPYYAAVSTAAGLLWTFAFQLPAASLEFIPIWLGLAFFSRVAGPLLWDRLCDFDSRYPASPLRSVALETAILGAGVYQASGFYSGFWPGRLYPVLAWLSWPALRILTSSLVRPRARRAGWLGLALSYVAFVLIVAIIRQGARAESMRMTGVFLGWCLVGILVARGTWGALASRRPRPLGEVARWTVIATLGLWLMRGYSTADLYGAGDAQWYGTMLADAVAQVRAGVFPIWMGQSATQFNGAIYPLRIAPGFHYLGVLLDALTFHTGGIFALQNLLLTLVALASLFCCYFSLAVLAPLRRWTALALALVFFACPGVLGMAYMNDLLMSWMTLPWVVLAWFATIRSFQDGGRTPTMALLGVSLGLCWWGHSPIALWMTLIAGALQVVRLGRLLPSVPRMAPLAVGAFSFVAVAAYPLGSVLLYPPEPGLRVDAFQQATASSLAYFVREVFPAILLPLSHGGHQLGDLQLGYSLWALFFLCLWAYAGRRSLPLGACLGVGLVLLLLLIPVPWLNPALWACVPKFIRNATSNWAMNRLYLPLAGALVFAAGSLLDRIPRAAAPPAALRCNDRARLLLEPDRSLGIPPRPL